MPALRTELTEIVTGLGMLGTPDPEAALSGEHPPAALRNVDDEVWARLVEAARQREHAAHVLAAWQNGRALLGAEEGLRGRVPLVIEWKGGHRDPGDEVVPADLRIDHVYLVSCKYLSGILRNASPAALVERNLAGSHGRRSEADWFHAVAPAEYQELYRLVRHHHARDLGLPERASDLGPAERRALRERLRSGWDPACAVAYSQLAARVSALSAERWRASLDTQRDRSAMLWRLLRIGATPYFVLGSGADGPLRLRVCTPWDWRQAWTLRGFEIEGDGVGQARVSWRAEVRAADGADHVVAGHVEFRWSHGRFGGPPEAKIYLDTPHRRVPGYLPLR